jgi:hypothetical protein
MISIIKSKLKIKYKNKSENVKKVNKYYKDFAPAVRQ